MNEACRAALFGLSLLFTPLVTRIVDGRLRPDRASWARRSSVEPESLSPRLIAAGPRVKGPVIVVRRQ